MQLTYKLIAGDGKEYGPVTADEFQSWIRDGRVGPESQVQRSDRENWAAAATFAELGVGREPISATATPQSGDAALLERSMKSAASWFYWIAALSVVNSVVALTGSAWHFVLGLGITRVFDEIGAQFGSTAAVVALALNAAVAGIFVLLGVFAHKGRMWSFITGMLLLAFDGVLTALFQDWISLAFHAFVLFVMFKGLQASRALRAAR